MCIYSSTLISAIQDKILQNLIIVHYECINSHYKGNPWRDPHREAVGLNRNICNSSCLSFYNIWEMHIAKDSERK